MIPDYTPWIVCAAMRHPTTGRIICGARHYDPIMREQIKASEGVTAWLGCDQGFIDQCGAFLTREEALEIAKANGQIKQVVGGGNRQLFSEMLW